MMTILKEMRELRGCLPKDKRTTKERVREAYMKLRSSSVCNTNGDSTLTNSLDEL